MGRGHARHSQGGVTGQAAYCPPAAIRHKEIIMQTNEQPIKIKFMDWRRLPRAFRSVVAGQPQVLVSRTGRQFFVPVEFV
jgi:hypothetical protein